jgi:2-desacetyl-2-hydroxyethyl bacteriochlorophyllide A dehydrogenase
MKAVVLKGPRDLMVLDVPKMKPGPGQLLVRVRKCGICGSDVRYFNGENPWAKQTLGRETPNPPNIILGHEFVGIVEEVCEDKDSALIGKRVAVNTFITCGHCTFCRNGQENLCANTKHLGHGQGWGVMDYYPGGMAEYCLAFASQVYELPDHVSDEEATFLDPMIAALHAVDIGGPKPLDRVAVYGAGPIGLLIAQYAKAFGAILTFISDVAGENLEVARALGVDLVVNVSGQVRFLDEVMTQSGNEGVDLAFNTVGTTESIEESLAILKKGGTVVLLAAKEDLIRFPALLLSGERCLRTSSNAMYSDFPRALEFLASGTIRVAPLITHRFSLSDAVRAFEVACNKSRSGAIKVILDCSSGD